MKEKNRWGGIFIWVAIFLVLLYFLQSVRHIGVEQEIPYSAFKKQLRAGTVAQVSVAPELIRGKYRAEDNKVVNFKTVPLPDPNLVTELEQYNVSQYSGDVDKG